MPANNSRAIHTHTYTKLSSFSGTARACSDDFLTIRLLTLRLLRDSLAVLILGYFSYENEIIHQRLDYIHR